MRELRMSDPEYRAKMEEKERLALKGKRNVRSVLQRRKRLLWQNERSRQKKVIRKPSESLRSVEPLKGAFKEISRKA